MKRKPMKEKTNFIAPPVKVYSYKDFDLIVKVGDRIFGVDINMKNFNVCNIKKLEIHTNPSVFYDPYVVFFDEKGIYRPGIKFNLFFRVGHRKKYYPVNINKTTDNDSEESPIKNLNIASDTTLDINQIVKRHVRHLLNELKLENRKLSFKN